MEPPASLLTAAAAVWLALAAAYQAFAWLCLRSLLRRPRETPRGPLPTRTILRPLRGDDPGAERCLESLARLDAPIVVGVGEDDAAGREIVRRVAHRFPGARLAARPAGEAPSGNRKVARLAGILPEASGDIVIFTDADISVPPGYLEAVLAPFADPRVGLVTLPYRSVGGASLPERIDVLLTNAGFLPSAALAARLEGVRFALGATIAVRRSTLEAIGGLEPFRDLLAEDFALAQRVLGTGARIVLAPLLLDHHIEGVGWSDLWRRQVRWARTTRLVRPGGYTGLVVTHGLLPALALVPAAGAAPLAAWLALRIGGAAWLRRDLGLGAADLMVLPAADLYAAAVFAAGLGGRSVRWGGTRLRVGRGGRLGPLPGEATGPPAPLAPAPPDPGRGGSSD